MTLQAAKCPNCAGSLEVPDDKATVKCLYCKSEIVVRDAIQLAIGRVKHFTKAEPIRQEPNPEQSHRRRVGAKRSFTVSGISLVVSLISGVALAAMGNDDFSGLEALIFVVALMVLGLSFAIAVMAFIFGLILNAHADAPSSNQLLGWIGPCPYCETQVTMGAADKGLTCPACHKRFVLRESKFVSVDTPVGVAGVGA